MLIALFFAQVNQTMQKKAVLTELNRQLADMAEELQAQRDKHGDRQIRPLRCSSLTQFQVFLCLRIDTEAFSCRSRGRPRAFASSRLTSLPKWKKSAW